MTDADKIAELEAYIRMLELNFETRVKASIERRLPYEVDKEIQRRQTAAAFEKSKQASQQLLETITNLTASAHIASEVLGRIEGIDTVDF